MSTDVRVGANRFQQPYMGVIIHFVAVFHTLKKNVYNVIPRRLWINGFQTNPCISTKVANLESICDF
jgi:hypothetical protein